MMTVDQLVKDGAILRIDVDLGAREQPQRLLYGTPNFIEWLRERIEARETSPLGIDLSPAEQLDAIFHAFVSGRQLTFSRQFRFIHAERNAVWELKTPDLRIFGWFMIKDCFVAVFGDWADKVKDHDLYRGYRLEIRRLRRSLGVDEALCVTGVEPSDVLSS